MSDMMVKVQVRIVLIPYMKSYMVVNKCQSHGFGRRQYSIFTCVYVPEQLVLQARLGYSEIDDCNFDTHLKGNKNTHNALNNIQIVLKCISIILYHTDTILQVHKTL